MVKGLENFDKKGRMNMSLLDKEKNLFKEAYKRASGDFYRIADIKDDKARLKEYEKLKESFANLYGSDRLQKAADEITTNMDKVHNKGLIAMVAGGIGTGVAAGLVVTIPFVAPAAGLAFYGASRRLSYAKQGEKTGLTGTDVKYVLKARTLEETLDKEIKRTAVRVEKLGR
jgi:hypothetical protein